MQSSDFVLISNVSLSLTTNYDLLLQNFVVPESLRMKLFILREAKQVNARKQVLKIITLKAE